MQPVILLLLLLTATAGLGQPAEPLRIDRLSPQGVLLDIGWRWYASDNPDCTKPEFDDSQWDSIDPTKDILALPQLRWPRFAVQTKGLAAINQKIAPAVKNLYESTQQSTTQIMSYFQIGSRRTLYRLLRYAGVEVSAMVGGRRVSENPL